MSQEEHDALEEDLRQHIDIEAGLTKIVEPLQIADGQHRIAALTDIAIGELADALPPGHTVYLPEFGATMKRWSEPEGGEHPIDDDGGPTDEETDEERPQAEHENP